MGDIQFSNNASALLAASITDVETTVQVDAGFGALFPSPGATEFFKLTLENASGDIEIMHCTARSGDLLTVTRGEEATTAIAWTLNVTRCELRNTSQTMDEFLQRSGDDMQGDLAMGGNDLTDARLTGDTVIVNGQAVGMPLRGTEDDASNEVSVPSDGTRATAGGSPLIVQADNLLTLMPVGSIILWNTGLGSLPTGWQNCDGTNGSPDLRDNFARGAGGAFALGATGGAATASGNTSSDGIHTHTGGGGGSHVLTTNEMPNHGHRILDRQQSGSGIADGSFMRNTQGFSGTRNTSGTVRYDTNSLSGNRFIEREGGGAGHIHSGAPISNSGGHTHSLSSIAIIPPFVAIYYVVKVS